jgi:flagellar protein FlgJ
MSSQISLSGSSGQKIDFNDHVMRPPSITSKEQISGLPDEKIKEKCKEFESLFVNFLLKEMRATVHDTGFISGGKAEEYYTAMLDTEFAKEIASGKGVGLSAMLYEQMKTVNGQETITKE